MKSSAAAVAAAAGLVALIAASGAIAAPLRGVVKDAKLNRLICELVRVRLGVILLNA